MAPEACHAHTVDVQATKRVKTTFVHLWWLMVMRQKYQEYQTNGITGNCKILKQDFGIANGQLKAKSSAELPSGVDAVHFTECVCR